MQSRTIHTRNPTIPDIQNFKKVEDDQILAIGKDDAKRAAAEFTDLNREDSSAKSLVESP